MGIYRVFAGSDGESHMEELRLEEHPELGALTNIHEVRVQQFDGTRKRDFNPLPERRLIIHLSGEVEIGTSDGSRQVFRAGDIRHCVADITQAHAELGYEPRVRFENGMHELAGWLAEQTAEDRIAQATADLASRGLTR